MAQSLQGVRDFFSSWNETGFASNLEVGIFPSALHLEQALQLKAQKNFKLSIGAQDCSTENAGAFTGEISAKQMAEIGCTTVLVGHSERRQRGGETNQSLRQKLDRAFEASLTPLFCVGETAEQRDSGKLIEVLDAQMKVVEGEKRSFILAYEPVWAIGTGRVPTMAEIGEVHGYLKTKVQSGVGILYGGSVKPENAASILSVEGVSGLLVGGASLKALDFKKIVESAANR